MVNSISVRLSKKVPTVHTALTFTSSFLSRGGMSTQVGSDFTERPGNPSLYGWKSGCWLPIENIKATILSQSS